MTAKLRAPVDVLVLGTTNTPESAERSCWRPGTVETGRQNPDRYGGASPWRHLYTVIAVRNTMRWRTGSQWRSRSTGVICSYFLVPVTRRAAAFFSAVCARHIHRHQPTARYSNRVGYWWRREWASWLHRQSMIVWPLAAVAAGKNKSDRLKRRDQPCLVDDRWWRRGRTLCPRDAQRPTAVSVQWRQV